MVMFDDEVVRERERKEKPNKNMQTEEKLKKTF